MTTKFGVLLISASSHPMLKAIQQALLEAIVLQIEKTDMTLPEKSVSASNDLISCREAQMGQLAMLLDPQLSSPSTIVIHGIKATGKTLALNAVLDSTGIPHAVVRSADWVDSRQILEEVISASQEALKNADGDDVDVDGRCENISSFVVQLQRLLFDRGRFILVFDGIDRQRESLPTLLAAIARLGEIIPNLSIILVVTAPLYRLLHLTGVPHIHFPPYTRSESIQIISSSPLCIANIMKTDSEWLWTHFCGAVWDSLGQAAARDIVSFRQVCHRLWEPFTRPISQGHHGPRELPKLIVKNRAVFQGDMMLEPEIIPWNSDQTSKPHHRHPTFPLFTTYLLIAAYLASHTPPRTDCLRFSKFYQTNHKRPSKPKANSSRARCRKIPSHLLPPTSFPTERLYAIFHAIIPPELSDRARGVDLDEDVAILGGRRLLARSSAAGDDALSVKWRVGFGLEFVEELARGVGFEIEGWLWD